MDDLDFEYLRQFLKTQERNQVYKGLISGINNANFIQKNTSVNSTPRSQWTRRGGKASWGKKRSTQVFEIQGTESNSAAELCQATRDQNSWNVNQPAHLCSHFVVAAEEMPIVRKRLRVKLRMGDSKNWSWIWWIQALDVT